MRTGKNEQFSYCCAGQISSQDLPTMGYIDRHNQVSKNYVRIPSDYMLHTTLYVTAISVAKSAKADLLQHLYNSSNAMTDIHTSLEHLNLLQ